MSFDKLEAVKQNGYASQSLWNRAMSFDRKTTKVKGGQMSLNPFGTGQCLSTQY